MRGFVQKMRQANSTFQILSPTPNATQTTMQPLHWELDAWAHQKGGLEPDWKDAQVSVSGEIGVQEPFSMANSMLLQMEVLQESFFFLFSRYDSRKNRTNTSSPELGAMLPWGGQASTAYEPSGKPCLSVVSGVVMSLSFIRIASRIALLYVGRKGSRVSFGLASSTATNVCGGALGLAANSVSWLDSVVS